MSAQACFSQSCGQGYVQYLVSLFDLPSEMLLPDWIDTTGIMHTPGAQTEHRQISWPKCDRLSPRRYAYDIYAHIYRYAYATDCAKSATVCFFKHLRLLFCRADLQNAVCWSGTKTHSVCSCQNTYNKQKECLGSFCLSEGKSQTAHCRARNLLSAVRCRTWILFTKQLLVLQLSTTFHLRRIAQSAQSCGIRAQFPIGANLSYAVVRFFQECIQAPDISTCCCQSLQHVDIKFWTHLHMQCANRHADPGQVRGGVDHGTTAQYVQF